MEYLHWFPHINATLNSLSGIFLILGFIFIKMRVIHLHRACMLTAFVTSSVFLICYIIHHSIRTYYFGLGPTKFTGEGAARSFYFLILGTHTVLAAVIGPLILITMYRALKGRFEMHRRIARWVYPIWLYVSITGVIVYLMLYQIYR